MASKTIILVGRGTRKERVAAAAITPGHLVELKSTGKVGVHSTAGGNAQKAFAVEDDLQGNSISDVYAADDRVQYNIMNSGDVVNAILADGESIAIGDPVESAGDGTFQKHDPTSSSSLNYPASVVGYALTALDLSDSSGADPASSRFNLEVI